MKQIQCEKRVVPETACSENLNERPKSAKDYKFQSKNQKTTKDKKINIHENKLLDDNREIASEMGPAKTDINLESNFEDDVQ